MRDSRDAVPALLTMAPSKANLEMERRKSDVPFEGDAEGPGVLGGLTTALTHLSLHPDTPPKDLAKLEDHLSQITLDDTQTQEEDFKRHKEEEEEKEEAEPLKKRETEEEDLKRQEEEEEEKKKIKEKEAEKSETEEEEEEKEKIKEKEAEKSETEEEEEEKEDKIKKESEQSEAEEEEEEKATVDASKKKGEVVDEKKPSEGKILQEVKEEKDSREKDEKEEEEEEEEEDGEKESDDENPTDEEVNAQARKQKLRSRGLMHQGVGHGYAPSSHLDYQGFQQQPQQQQILYQQPPLASHHIGLSSPQYGEAAGYAGASPTHSGAKGEMWYSGGGVQLETECGTSLFPSLAEGSPASICSSGDSDSPRVVWGGYGTLDSPQPQYQDGNASCYAQPCQDSPYTHYQASPNCQYQLSPPHYPDNALPQYASYQDPLDAGFQDQGYQDQSYQMSPFLDGGCVGTLVHSTPVTPPLSPPNAETRMEVKGNQLDQICEAFESIMEDNEPRIPQDEKRIIEIKKSLLDIKQVHNLQEGLDEEKYREYYGACAILIDENFVEPDEDGDIKIMLAASQGQTQPGYEERLVAMTERVQNINLCCNTVVDWHVDHCRLCGNTNKELFYSPLSWMNNYGQMVLSNVVSEMYPLLVVQYLTKKVMQRPMDLQRTFTKHYQLFFTHQDVYPCLTQPLRMVKTMQMQHTEHGTTH
ncbi:uncharacterized protein LOC126985947 isoform X3 [Eriocheir sinensis]|uniref:uncharacterized protein LOC126985947 isoform X3 n=1 Tax=Eriocheir sinensis TaxID=95602 RepID=UPI0021C7D3D5|nr:uncharacterized protein LOC126985947 isoform X3 [Eriocheir sinensis]